MTRLSCGMLALGAVLVIPAAALGQPEGAAGLDAPREPPATVVLHEVAPIPEPPGEDAAPAPAAEAPSAYEVPPPPTGPRYPRAQAGEPRGLETRSSRIDIPSRIATRLRVLDADLGALANRGGNGIVDGVLSMLSGALSITLGVLVDEDLLRTYLFLWGGANVARGIIDLVVSPNASEPAIQYAHMPMDSPTEVRRRLEFGEDALHSLARRTRLARILDASINIAVGVAVVPLYLGPNDFEIQSPFDYFVLIGSGISVISGIINLATRSEAEKRWNAYDELRGRLSREHREQRERASLRLGVAPLPRGGAATLDATF